MFKSNAAQRHPKIQVLASVVNSKYSAQVPPIPQKHTVTFLNHYLSRSSQLLNELSSAAERKLEKVLTQLQQVEAGVCILEAKVRTLRLLKIDPTINFQRYGGCALAIDRL